MEAMETGGGKVERRLQANRAAAGVTTVRTRVAREGSTRRSERRHVAKFAPVFDKVLEQDVLVIEVEALSISEYTFIYGLTVHQSETGSRHNHLAQVLPERHVGVVRQREGLEAAKRDELEHWGGRRGVVSQAFYTFHHLRRTASNGSATRTILRQVIHPLHQQKRRRVGPEDGDKLMRICFALLRNEHNGYSAIDMAE
jgi:hypothetical protein